MKSQRSDVNTQICKYEDKRERERESAREQRERQFSYVIIIFWLYPLCMCSTIGCVLRRRWWHLRVRSRTCSRKSLNCKAKPLFYGKNDFVWIVCSSSLPCSFSSFSFNTFAHYFIFNHVTLSVSSSLAGNLCAIENISKENRIL